MSRALRTWTRNLGVLAVLALLIGACGGDDAGGGDTTPTRASGSESGPDASEADRDAAFRYALFYSVSSFDPHRSPIPTSDAIFMGPVYDRLVTLARDEDGSVVVGPQLATSWEISDDARQIEFELRDDATFHDGTPFNAEAVKANIARAQDPESTIASVLSMVESVEVVDDTNVVFHLNKPYPGLLYTLATSTNGMMVSPAAFETDLATKPVGAGPFELVSFQKDGDSVYERWDEHWDPDAALVSKLTVTTVLDANARLNGLRSGTYDAISPQGADEESQRFESEGFQWINELGPLSVGLLFNNEQEPFDDVRVIKAVSMALNRTEISEQLVGGLGPPMYQTFPEGYVGHNPDAEVDPYDPDAAQELIDEAGVEGETVTLLSQTHEPYNTIAQVIQQALGDIGLNVELNTLAPAETLARWPEGNDSFYITSIFGEAEPSVALDKAYLGGQNPGTPPADVVQMADEALSLPLGSAERDEAYQEISAHLVENPIHVPLYQFYSVTVAADDVVNASELVKVSLGKIDFRHVGIAAS